MQHRLGLCFLRPYGHSWIGTHNSPFPLTAIDSCLRLPYLARGGCFLKDLLLLIFPGLWSISCLYGNTKHKALEMYHAAGRKERNQVLTIEKWTEDRMLQMSVVHFLYMLLEELQGLLSRSLKVYGNFNPHGI